MAKTFEQFRKEVLGKRYDMDGYYGSQCWDGYAYYMKWLGYAYANCTTTKLVKDIWNNRKTNGMLKSCDEVTVMQPGDIAVFKETDWTPASHIAMFVRDVDGQYGIFLGQNQGGINGAFNEVKLPYYATYDTAFRPKCFKNSKPSTGGGNTNTSKKPDQVLTVGSKVQFTGFLRVEKYSNGKVYNSKIGEWLPASLLYEDSAKDGKKDQYFANTNATFTIKGTYTVTDVSAKNNTVYLKELKCWVNAGPLVETKEGK